MSDKNQKPRPLKAVNLAVHGIGLSAKETEAIAAEMDAKLAKLNCCERAAMNLGLMMMTHHLDLRQVVDILEYGNHLIHKKDGTDGKPRYEISKALMRFLKDDGAAPGEPAAEERGE